MSKKPNVYVKQDFIGYEGLAMAIIKMAASDYRIQLAKLKNKHNRVELAAKTETEKFFKSSWFRALTTNIDGEYIVNRLKREVWDDDR